MISQLRNPFLKKIIRNSILFSLLTALTVHPIYATKKTTPTSKEVSNRVTKKVAAKPFVTKSKKTNRDFKLIYNSKTKHILHGIHTKEKMISLTFDDGPEPKMTPIILELLKEHQIKATFFVIGSNCKKYPDILKQIEADGHEIANHSWSHRVFSKLSNAAIANELRDTTAEVKRHNVKISNWFRAPYGNLSANQAKYVHELGYRTLHWNVDTRDWSGISDAEMMRIFRKQFKPGSVVLMHTLLGRKNKPSHLPSLLNELIPEYQKKGYQFVTATELVN